MNTPISQQFLTERFDVRLRPTADAKTKALFIDASTLKRFMECPRAFEYYFLHRREAAVPRIGRDFGRCWHTVMKAYRSAETDPYAAASAALPDAFADFTPLDDDHRNEGFAQRLLALYYQRFGTRDIIAHHNSKPLVELPFACELASFADPTRDERVKIIWTGRIDAVVQNDSGHFVLDTKTSSIGGVQFFDQYIRDVSLFGYCWALRAATGITPAGFIVDGVITRSDLTPKGKGPEFMRRVFAVSEAELEEWAENTRTNITNVYHAIHYANHLPMFSTGCRRRFGNCEYLDVCALPRREQRGEMLHETGLYRDVIWTPLDEPEE